MSVKNPSLEDRSPDADDRVSDFLARHGGPGAIEAKSQTVVPDEHGWSEVYAADGYTLRCNWHRAGSREEMEFLEIPPPEHTQHP